MFTTMTKENTVKKLWVTLCLASALGASGTTALADEIKIGYVNTFSGPGAILGKHYRDAFELAVDELGGKMAGLDVKVEYGDDQLKPEIAKTVVERMVERDDVDIVAGFNFSNVLLASLKTVTDADKLLISSNAGPSNLAGEQCQPNFFSVGQQNDGASEALGRYLKEQNVESVYALAPNYQAGRGLCVHARRQRHQLRQAVGTGRPEQRNTPLFGVFGRPHHLAGYRPLRRPMHPYQRLGLLALVDESGQILLQFEPLKGE